MNVAYKHLDSKLRIAELTIGQWIAILLGAGCGIAWGMYLSPFGPTLTLTIAIYVAALPAGAALIAGWTDFDPWLTIRSAVAWRRREGRFLPGPGRSVYGYIVIADAEALDRGRRTTLTELDYSALWEGP